MTHAPDSSPSADTALPERLGVYRIESQLGRGGMGDVYLAWDELLERHVAIKRIQADKLLDSTHRARFLREARAVARLDHPSIVRLYHVLERDDGDCLVMEYVRGRDLARVAAEGAVGLARAVGLVREIALGLAEAHAHGLVHRDLKLANVMLVQDGDGRPAFPPDRVPPDRIKILDFGLAKPVWQGEGPKDDDQSLTQSGAIIGTAIALSPEQVRGEALDHRSDLFALGSLFYELLCGLSPFRGRTIFDTLRRVMAEEPQPIAERVAGIPEELARLVAALLAKEPAKRPASAQIVAARLQEIGAGLSAEPSGRPFEVPGEQQAVVDVGLLPATAFSMLPRPVAASPGPVSERPSPVIRTLVHVELLQAAGERTTLHLELKRPATHELLERFNGVEVGDGHGLALLFERPAEAVAFALAFHRALADRPGEPRARIGIHLGEVALRRRPGGEGSGPLVEGAALGVAALLASRANGRQTLLGRSAFDLARGAVAPVELTDPEIRWLAHGTYRFGGLDEAVEVFEVGIAGFAPLAEPPESTQTHRAVAHGDELALGWRPAVGQPVPRRANWELSERLGEGGFGEVWLARHKSGEERVFKFCFEAERLRALKREVTLFRLLGEALGHRRDIARVLDWDFDAVPYFLESEYTDGGDLVTWAERRGGLAAVPMATRLELVAQVAEALAAAHSVGILHKDVKPRNVLIATDADGRPQARLTDFGIGLLADRSRLREPGFTVLGFTETGLATDPVAGGTMRYMAPELLDGKPATIQGDVYSLGVVLYQMVAGDFGRTLARGWQRDVKDDLLAEDIAACVDGAPERRPASALELAERLRQLDERRREQVGVEQARLAEIRARRRRSIAGTLGVAGAISLLLISVFAYQTVKAKDRELAARESAEQRRRQAEKLIDFLLGDLREKLQPIGKLDILDQVGDQAIAYFASVPASDLSTEEMRNYAKALHQIGQVRFALGKLPSATAAFGQSLTMAENLAALDPQNADWQFELGQSHFWAGYLHWQEKRLDAALSKFETYRSISERLVARDPQNDLWQVELAYSHSNIATIFQSQGKNIEASRSLEASARIFEGLCLRKPSDVQLSIELAQVYAKLGQLLFDRGELQQARGRFEGSLNVLTRAASARPGDMDLQFLLNTAHFHLGTTLVAQGEASAALGSYRSSLAICRNLVAHDPKHRIWLGTLVQVLDMAARVALSLSLTGEAQELLEEERTILRGLFGETQEDRPWRLARARNLWSTACLELVRGRTRDALRVLEEALPEFRELMASDETRATKYWVARTLEKLGESYLRSRDHERSVEFLGQSRALAAELVAAEPTPWHLEAMVRSLVLMGNTAEASPLIERLAAIGYRRIEYLELVESKGK